MASLLDGMNDPMLQLGLQLMSAGSAQPGGGSFGRGALQALQGTQGFMQQQQALKAQEQERAMRQALMQAQIGETQAQAQQRQAEAAKLQQVAARNAAFEAALQKGRTTPQQALFGGGGPTPQNAAQIGQQTAPDWQALASQFPEQMASIEKLAGAGNWGVPEVARTEDTMLNGAPVKQQFDKQGRPVGQALPQWKAPVFEDLGGARAAIDPVSLKLLAQLQKSISPDAQLGANTTMRGQNMTDSRSRELAQITRAGQGQLIDTGEGYVRVGQDNGVTPVMGPDGKQLQGKRSNQALTDTQAKALLFGTRMQESDKILNEMGAQGVERPGNIRSAGEAISHEWPIVGGALSMAGNAAQSGPQQKVEQAQRDFINAVLRRESGMAISQSEFESARKQYFPEVGDKPDKIQQKAANRALATRGILAEVPSGRGISPLAPASRAPAVGTVQDGYRFKGGNPADPASWEKQ